jgi:hypothetical protein
MGAFITEHLPHALAALPVTIPTIAYLCIRLTRGRAWTISYLAAWLTSPLWAGVPVSIGFDMAGAASYFPMLLLAGVPWCVVTVLALFASRSARFALAVGGAAYAAPIGAVIAVERTGALWPLLAIAVLWNLWMIGACAIARGSRAGTTADSQLPV